MFTGLSPLLGFEGCSIVVNWVDNSIQSPWRWWPILAEIDQYFSDINKAVSCSVVLPSNGMAAWLADDGVLRKDFF
ncbi:hypothetical protein V6N13_101294 [Hibiscus sabdariffa]